MPYRFLYIKIIFYQREAAFVHPKNYFKYIKTKAFNIKSYVAKSAPFRTRPINAPASSSDRSTMGALDFSSNFGCFEVDTPLKCSDNGENGTGSIYK